MGVFFLFFAKRVNNLYSVWEPREQRHWPQKALPETHLFIQGHTVEWVTKCLTEKPYPRRQSKEWVYMGTRPAMGRWGVRGPELELSTGGPTRRAPALAPRGV